MTTRPPLEHSWSEAARSVWGKSSGYDGAEWMPLVQHLTDAADVASYVWDWLPPSARTAIERGLPEGARDGQTLLRWLAGIHDVGKCSPPFAAKVPPLADRMRDHGLALPRDTTDFTKAPHGLVGHVIVDGWLRDHGATPRSARSYAVVVGGHHGVPPTSTQLQWVRHRAELVGDAQWQQVQTEILDQMARQTGATDFLRLWGPHRLDPTAQALLTGAVIVADWLASNTELFPFDTHDEARTQRAWNDLGLPRYWHPPTPPRDIGEHLRSRFPGLGSEPRPIQQLTVAAADQAASQPLVIVEAAMGSGKTEAALLAAEVLASRFGGGGVYVGLPTMATSDAMFRRVLDWIDHLEGDGTASTYLAHGKAGLNDDYRGLRRGERLSPVYDDSLPAGRVEAQVQAWLTGRKKGVLASMVVGTIDQVLYTALQAKHVALRHLAFAGKVVIIDEVHAADDYMRMYLCRTLEWLAGYGVPVVLLSATLPSTQRQELADAYRLGLDRSPAQLAPSDDYPLVTTVTADEITAASDEAVSASATVSIRTVGDELDELTSLIDDWLVDGGCIAIIRNTVSRAQDTAERLRQHYGDDVVLHHSRFLATHRARRETELRGELGRDGARPHRRIVVGTQVLEQSLDVDFDAMVTDLAPIDLVLQRMGRLHRHPRARPAALSRPQVVLTGISEWGADGPVLDPGSLRVYGPSRLLRAAGVLGLTADASTSIQIPDNIRDLVEAAYGEPPSVPSAWLERALTADGERANEIARARDRADSFRIRSIPDLEGSLVGWLEDSSTEAEDSQGSARVRDSDDGIEVIVTQRVDGEVRVIDDRGRFDSPHAGQHIPTDLAAPASELARELASTTVRLPLTMTASPRDFDRVLDALELNAYEGWQQSPWLAGQLVLHLDGDWQASVAGFSLTYDLDQGLSVHREEST